MKENSENPALCMKGRSETLHPKGPARPGSAPLRQRGAFLCSPWFVFACFFAAFYALLLPIELWYGSDDTAHFEKLDALGVWGWLMWRAQSWEPRLFSDLAYALFIHHLPLWRAVNAAFAAALALSVWRASGGKESPKPTLMAALVCLLFFTIHPNVVTSSAIWYTGSFNYLWPVACLMFGIAPFLRALRGEGAYGARINFHIFPQPPSPATPQDSIPATPQTASPAPRCAMRFALSLIASLLACFTEQTALVQAGVCILALLWCHVRHARAAKRIGLDTPSPLSAASAPASPPAAPPRLLYVHAACVLACAAWFLHAVLTSPRMEGGSELSLFPEFAYYSKLDKLILGANVYDTQLLRESNLLFFALALAAGLLAWRALKCAHPFARALAVFPAFYTFTTSLPLRYIMNGYWNYSAGSASTIGMRSAFDRDPYEWLSFLTRVPPLDPHAEPRDCVPAWLALAAALLVFYALFHAFDAPHKRFAACLLYAAAYASGAIMGFSPTVFASGSRPYFLSNILILAVCAMLAASAQRSCDPRVRAFSLAESRAARIALALISALALYALFLYKYAFATMGYWWY